MTDIKVTNILTELKFISEIKPNDKLCYNNNEINIDDSYLKSLTRWWNNYNRKDTIAALETIYVTTFELLDILINNQKQNILTLNEYKNIDLLHELIKHLDISLMGLNSLKITYDTDKHTVSKLDTLINKIIFQKQYAITNIQFTVAK